MSKPSINGIVIIDGLMYQNQPFIERYRWEEAKEYAKNLRLGGYDDWRMPTITELNKVRNPKLDKWQGSEIWNDWMLRHEKLLYKNTMDKVCCTRKEFVKNMPEYSFFWSSTEHENDESVCTEYFNDIRAIHTRKDNQSYIICVRSI